MKKYRVVIIGGGNVAQHLIRQVTGAGHKLVQIFNRTLSAINHTSSDSEAIKTDNILQLTQEADIYIVCVKDAAIELLAKDISLTDKLIVHTAGTTSMHKLKGCSTQYGIFYPLQSFSKNLEVNFKEIPIIIEANNDEATSKLDSFAKSISDKVIYLNEAQRIPIHISGVFVNNFVNHLFSLTDAYLKSQQLEFELLKPLIHQTIEKLKFGNPAEMQTGPAMRGDKATIESHLTILQSNKELYDIYKLMTESILRSHHHHNA